MDVKSAVETAFESNDKYAVASWDDYIGQPHAKKVINVKVNAAKKKGQLVGHMLIIGGAGTGKSSIASMIAQEHGVDFMPLLITPNFNMNTLGQALVNFDQEVGGGIVFLDEIHNLNEAKQQYLYSVLQDGAVVYDSGNKYKFQNEISFIAATTDEDRLTESFRGRFKQTIKLNQYSVEEMAQIIERMCIAVGVEPTVEGCIALAHASAGSPRQAGTLVDLAEDLGEIDLDLILELAQITPDGLNVDHKDYLLALKTLGGTAGLEAIHSTSGRPKVTLQRAEKLLVNRGLVERGRGGRTMTALGLSAAMEFLKKENN